METRRILLAVVAAALVAVVAPAWHSDIPVGKLIPKYTNASSRFLDVGGVKVHYRDDGRGEALVLVHGMNSSLHTWEGWTEQLEGSYRVIALDLPGFGLTGPDPKKRYSPAQAAQFLHLFTDALGLEHFNLAGNSRGGAIAWNFAVLYPDEVERLILVDAGGLPREEPIPFLVVLQGLPMVSRLFHHITPRWVIEDGVHQVYGDPSLVTEAQVQRYFDLLLRTGNRRAASEIVAVGDLHENLDGLSKLKVPTLVLWGEKDAWILPKYAERFRQRIPRAEVIRYPALGHIPMEEDPAETAADVRKFLSRPRNHDDPI